ncbi:MAG: C40 family peptidase [Thermoanaerobacteraceae bacterium]|nr:C40 family peptidase [Thermoanaerobacteraceae bacterium]
MNKKIGKLIFGVSVFGMTLIGGSMLTYVYAGELGSGIVTGNYVNIRTGNSTSYEVITQLNWYDTVTVLGQDNGWYHIRLSNGSEGWIFGKYLSLKSSGGNSSRGNIDRSFSTRLIEYSKQFLGTRYVYGGSSPNGFDCSGFTQYVFGQFGIVIPRTADEQATVGTMVDFNNLAPGDLVFFRTLGSYTINHAGIYIGDGEFIHSSSGRGKVMISRIDSGYYYKNFAAARRVK